jgi:hypothetical protein
MPINDDTYKPGRLLEYEGTWRLILLVEDLDELSFLFQEEWGYEPNGASWEVVTETLVSMHFPELVPLLSFDSEADNFLVLCDDPEPLKTIAQMLRRLFLHPEELREALQKTEPD